MTEVDFKEASNLFPSLLDRIEKGEEITVTRQGKPVARLVAAPVPRDVRRARSAAEEILQMRASLPGGCLDDLSIAQLISEGRRF